ncbi:MAG: hypothetical protein U0359_07080 [Byssovorax sp.]
MRGFVAGMLDDPAQIETSSARITQAIEVSLRDHPWPRNLRELRHVTERALLEGGTVRIPAAGADLGDLHGSSSASIESGALPSSGLLGSAPRPARPRSTT